MTESTAAASRPQPHGLHVIGIGRTGAAYVEALLRTGEIEDVLAHSGSSFAALLLDIGEDDMFVPNDYGRSLTKRLASREIPLDRYHYESVLLQTPGGEAFAKQLEAVRAPFKAATGQDLIPKLPKGDELPKVGQHTPRALSKALGAIGTHLGDKPIASALQRFADQVRKSEFPSTVLVVFGLAGGTGSGMAADLARALRLLLPANAQVAGLGQLSHSGDGDYFNSLAQTTALEEIDASAAKDASPQPFPGGFFVVTTEHSWQRLTAYTSTGIREVRQRFKQMVTNRFVADSFMRWAIADSGAHLARALSRAHGRWILFDVAKLTHPGVQVLPGEAGSRWDSVLQQWIGFTPQFSGLSDGFKTDYAEIHVYAPRDTRIDMIEEELRRVVSAAYVKGNRNAVSTYRSEFFDALTAYGNVILPGATKDDLVAYREAKAGATKLSATARALETA
ncbi:hypothetical protein A9Y76_10855 [Ralstonia insidiosa]|jgi:Tubulin like|uniref:Tubulin/FtsZ GTPase domain-containing protein n=2 Tax=Ralstonia TaxID=48736 RepID=A0A191ZXX3_9RALS|nr:MULTISPECIES: tubulin-like doman-containing protein [Ralstonia]ANJ72933.1 hypothetical protein A9Y76_10855 [Ralstonia insidiosa]EPX97123.1 hypothetical protein C404_15020 [Ralstonia sp. AU12-08]MBT2177855.1 hypothetical protein [Ralstonia pickettii]CAJ0723039.1 hypothetical protein R38712_01583 [Ralstonia pickettii]